MQPILQTVNTESDLVENGSEQEFKLKQKPVDESTFRTSYWHTFVVANLQQNTWHFDSAKQPMTEVIKEIKIKMRS